MSSSARIQAASGLMKKTLEQRRDRFEYMDSVLDKLIALSGLLQEGHVTHGNSGEDALEDASLVGSLLPIFPVNVKHP
jgi:hypothetical protein